MAKEFLQLATDGHNWSVWYERLEQALNELRTDTYLYETMLDAYNEQTNAQVQCTIMSMLPDSLFTQIHHFDSVHKWFEYLRNKLKNKYAATQELLHDIWSTTTMWEAVYSLKMCSDICDTSHCDDNVSNGSIRQNHNVPHNSTTAHQECKQEPRS
ncbi:hypothetical protein PAXRUDRAFT_131663 [Paxillus rubicundulus Ve08.2h10]|uniref:Unplaced genomic scaffold scaffold_32, whole genome shotgun sequence n=1 Tax=Paxillus rubicundulus Ve08.2h10 TaxID=930991 RepID=A0A0D0E9P3_9AGAM|nr:hypothetical protein PAXRUDRAFT_131663 [Paxillus rubicundulus Ve08.2h10]